MKSSISKYVNQSTTTSPQLNNDNDNSITPNHHQFHPSQYNHYHGSQGILSHPSSRRSSIASTIHQQMVNKSDEMPLTEQAVQTLSPRSDRGGLGNSEGMVLVERNANWEQGGGVDLEIIPVCQCTVKDHHTIVPRLKHQQHFHHHASHAHSHQPHPHHQPHSYHAHPHFPPTKYNSVQNIALVNHQPFCASLSKLDGQWSSSTLINSTANSNNHQYSLERKETKKPLLKKQHSYTCESHQQPQMTQQQRIMARVERDLRMQQAQHLSRSPPLPLPTEVLAGNLLVSDGGFVNQASDQVDGTFGTDSDQRREQQVIKSPYSGSVGSGSGGKDSVIGRGHQGGGDDYGFSKRMQVQQQQHQQQEQVGQGQGGGGAQQGRGSKRSSLRSNGGSGGKRRPAGDGMAAITQLHDDNTDLIFELPDQMNESGVTLTVDGATTVVDCDHIIYGPGFTCIHFIPIKSIEILNVTNCDRFLETAINSNVTVTPTQTIIGPNAGKDGGGGKIQTVSISFTNDVALDENTVVSISDMKPDRNSFQNSDTPTNWIRNKLYISRHNLCDILNNYLATALFGNGKTTARKKIKNTPEYNEHPYSNNVESYTEESEIGQRETTKMRLCPIAAGHYVLPKMKWKSPPLSVPAIFLGYQKYMIEVIKPGIENKGYEVGEILMCNVVTVFIQPKKDYY